MTLPSFGFSLAVSGMMIPPLVFASSSMRFTRIRSCSGRIFMIGASWALPRASGRRWLERGAAVRSWHRTAECDSRAQCIAGARRGQAGGRVDFRLGFRALRCREDRGGRDGIRRADSDPSRAGSARSSISCAISSGERGYSPSLEEIGAQLRPLLGRDRAQARPAPRREGLPAEGVEPLALGRAGRGARTRARGRAAAPRQRRGRRADRGRRGSSERIAVPRGAGAGAARRPSCCACAATR